MTMGSSAVFAAVVNTPISYLPLHALLVCPASLLIKYDPMRFIICPVDHDTHCSCVIATHRRVLLLVWHALLVISPINPAPMFALRVMLVVSL
jgi:hypothetical protein